MNVRKVDTKKVTVTFIWLLTKFLYNMMLSQLKMYPKVSFCFIYFQQFYDPKHFSQLAQKHNVKHKHPTQTKKNIFEDVGHVQNLQSVFDSLTC